MPNKLKHLEMIEAIIERMVKNSLQLKGWTITLLTAVAPLASQGKRFMILTFIPLLGFWILDSFYLQQERKYKLLYKNVAKTPENKIAFNLDTRFASGTPSETKHLHFIRCMFSISELCFYPLIASAIIVLVILLNVF